MQQSSKGIPVVFIHRRGHFVRFNEHYFFFKFCCFDFFLLFRSVVCNLMLYIGVIIMEKWFYI